MIYFISGTPGAGKTLFTIQLLSKEKVRPVYYYKINLTPAGKDALPNWLSLDAEGVKNWGDLPDGSIVLIDEAHTIMGQRSAKDKVPKWIEDLAEHRHRGMDFYIVDQHPKDLDVFVRRRVYQHWHYFNVFGMDSSTKHTWQGYEDDQPNDYHAKQRAETSRHKFPKEVFAWYESASVHTKKKRIPWQLFAIPALFGFVGLIGWGAYDMLVAPKLDTQVAETPSPVPSSFPSAPVVGASVVQSVGSSALQPSPRRRVLYQNLKNAAIPDYVFTAESLYLTGTYEVGKYKGSEYELVLAGGEVMPVDDKFFKSIGALIMPFDDKCFHRISFPDFDLFTKCRPRVDSPDNSQAGDSVDSGTVSPSPESFPPFPSSQPSMNAT